MSFICVNSGVPIFPPKKHVYPCAFNIVYISVVVVVFPSLPVTPIIVLGVSFRTCSISDVTIAPLLASSTSSGVVGKQLGDLNI